MLKKIFFLAFVLIISACRKSADTTTPQRKDLTQAVYASGKIYPLNDYKVFSKLPGYIQKIHIKIGDVVEVGTPLMTIKSEVSELNVEAAKNAFSLAQKNADENAPLLSAMKQDVASSKSKYELDSLNFSRYTNLFKENACSKMQLDQARTQFEISQQTYFRVKNNLSSTRDRLRTEYENAKIQLDAQTSNRNDYTIVSAVAGKVYDIIPKEGELVGTQNILMEVGDKSNFEVELSIDETDVSFVQNGQEVIYAIDAYKENTYKGKVMESYPRINQSNKTSKVISSIQLDESVKIFSGMSVEANIIIAQKKNTLVIPREFIVNGNMVKLKSTKKLVTFKKGAEDLEFIEVLDGLKEGDEIILP